MTHITRIGFDLAKHFFQLMVWADRLHALYERIAGEYMRAVRPHGHDLRLASKGESI